MSLFIVLSLYMVAAAVPAYFLARNTTSIWWDILAWLVGVLVEFGAVAATFLTIVSINRDAAPVEVAVALVPPLPLLLMMPCAGVAAANVGRYIKRRHRGGTTHTQV